jgi:hypothetical protein
MKKNDFNDGICESCGNTGLAGEKCIVCVGVMSKIAQDAEDPMLTDDIDSKEPEVYPLEALDDEIKEGDDENIN